MRGFQLWINLPAREKMKPAAYRDIPPREIPTVALDGRRRGARDRRRASSRAACGRPGRSAGSSTDPLYFDVRLPAGVARDVADAGGHNAFLYVYEGDAVVGDDARPLPFRAAGLLTPGETVRSRRARRARGCCCSRASRSASRSCSTGRS